MELLHPRCAGLDVHKETVVACVRRAEHRPVQHEIRTFGTTTAQLLALVEWLAREGVTDVAMEATGVYWKPVWHVLEGSFGRVIRGSYLGSPVAVKLPTATICQPSQPHLIELCNELRILRHLRHPNVVSLFGALMDSGCGFLAIVLEL